MLPKQLIGQIGISVDNKESLVLAMGKSFLHFNRFESLEQVAQRIDALTTVQLLEVAQEVFDKSQLFRLIYE
jgi:predicted Zn-dependent peptidase